MSRQVKYHTLKFKKPACLRAQGEKRLVRNRRGREKLGKAFRKGDIMNLEG